MAKSKTAPRPVPSDDSKVVGTAASNVTPIKGRRRVTDPASTVDGAGAPAAPESISAAEPAIILFGCDESKKPHASWFTAADAELAERAAGLMGYHVLRVTSPDIRAKALELATGRVFAASGRGFVPFCKMAAYEALRAFPEAYAPPAPVEPEPVPPPAIAGTPQRWEDVDVGALVLANAGDDWGWHEAIVTEARGEELFVLRWQNWPDDPTFARRRDGLGLLPPPPAEADATAHAAPAPADLPAQGGKPANEGSSPG